jgi:four helix bundle protein
MSKRVERFEDLIAWQKAMDLAVRSHEISRVGDFARDFALSGQLHSAAISVPSNIAEGFERGTRAQFHHFLSIAKSSCAELRTQIQIANRIGYLKPTTAYETLQQAEEVSRIIGGLRTTVERQRRTPFI